MRARLAQMAGLLFFAIGLVASFAGPMVAPLQAAPAAALNKTIKIDSSVLLTHADTRQYVKVAFERGWIQRNRYFITVWDQNDPSIVTKVGSFGSKEVGSITLNTGLFKKSGFVFAHDGKGNLTITGEGWK